jgi:hypothetical protein
VVCGLDLLAILSGRKKSPPTLSLLAWEGYADPSFIQGFEAQCQCKVSAAYMGTSDELVAKLRGGAASNYDAISPLSDVATMLSRSGLVAPLDLAKIPNYTQLPQPSLRGAGPSRIAWCCCVTGKLRSADTTRNLLRPRTAYVASFLGKSNLIAGVVKQGVADCRAFSVPVTLADGPITFWLRPECIAPSSDVEYPFGAICSRSRCRAVSGADSIANAAMRIRS